METGTKIDINIGTNMGMGMDIRTGMRMEMDIGTSMGWG